MLDAESEGMVGYLLEQELGRHLPRERLATLLTQFLVDVADAAFTDPTKPVGPVYSEAEAREVARSRGWAIALDGTRWRRVVSRPSRARSSGWPRFRILVDHEVTVTCTGGGGLPVARDGHGGLRGVEAVIDKDLAAALLAIGLDADGLLLLTDVDGVYDGWGTEEARPLRQTTADQLRSLTLPAGSMGPKVEAVCRFVGAGGRFGAIGALADAAVIAGGDTGTIVHTRR